MLCQDAVSGWIVEKELITVRIIDHQEPVAP